jgi:hypothetical protein
MLPMLINENNLLNDYKQTCTNMYQALMQQYYKPYIFIYDVCVYIYISVLA